MIYIFYLFYPKELRSLIKKLKLEGRLVSKPLKIINIRFSIFCLIFMPILAYKMFEDIEALILLVIFFLITWLLVSLNSKKIIIPCSSDNIALAKLILKPELEKAFPVPFCPEFWVVKYEFIDTNIYNKVCIARIPKKHLSTNQAKRLNKLEVLYCKDNSKYNIPYIKDFIEKYRITANKINLKDN